MKVIIQRANLKSTLRPLLRIVKVLKEEIKQKYDFGKKKKNYKFASNTTFQREKKTKR